MAAADRVRLTLNVRELAGLLGVSHETAYSAVRRGLISAVKVGSRRVVIPLSVAEGILGREITPEMLEKAHPQRKRTARAGG